MVTFLLNFMVTKSLGLNKAFQLLDNKDTNDNIEAPEGIEDNAG